MILSSLLVAVLPVQEPASVPPPPTPAEKALASFQAKLEKAPALHFEAQAKMTMEMGDQKMPLGSFDFKFHFARPLNGSMDLHGVMEFMGQREEMTVQYLGDGESLWEVDPDAQTICNFGSDPSFLADPAMGFDPIALWTGRGLELDQVHLRTDEKKYPGLQGLELSGLGMTRTMWLDSQHAVKAFTMVPLEKGAGIPEIEMQVTSFELPEKIKLEDYEVPLPEGYELIELEELGYGDGGGIGDDYEENLLAVGDSAPEVTFIGMDDVQTSLASYKGKTVLLNFWFYH